MLERLSRLLQILLFVVTDHLKRVLEFAVGEDVEAATDLLFRVLVGDAAKRHFIQSVLFS